MKKFIAFSVITLMSMPATAMAEGGQVMRHQQQTGQLHMISPQAGNGLQRETVRELQLSLRQQGFNPGPIDGIWGPRTSAALRNYQQAAGLQPTGQPHPATMAQLGIRDMTSARAGSQMQTATVLEIQQALRQHGFNPGPVDGIWGPRTASAVRNFQMNQGLDATGQLNATTMTRLGVRGNVSGRTQMDPLGTTQDQMQGNPAGRTSAY